MFILLTVIVIITIAAYFLQKYGKKNYNYSILSVGGLGVSFLGAVAFVASCYFYSNHNPIGVIITIIIGCVPYVMMFIRDCKKMTVLLAFASALLRFSISVIIILIIIGFLFMRGSKDNK